MKKKTTRKNPAAVAGEKELDFYREDYPQSLIITVLIEKNEDGRFIGTAPDLQNCQARGRNRKELRENLQTMLELCIEADYEMGLDSSLKYLADMEFYKVETFSSTISISTRKKKTFNFSVLIRIDTEDGGYVAEVPALNGCITEGDTEKELYQNIEDVIDLYLNHFLEYHKAYEIPNREYIDVEFIEVNLA